MVTESKRRSIRCLLMERLESRYALSAGGPDLSFGSGGVLDVEKWLQVASTDQFKFADIRSVDSAYVDLIVQQFSPMAIHWVRFHRDGTQDLSFGTEAIDEFRDPQLETLYAQHGDYFLRYFSDGSIDASFTGRDLHYDSYDRLPAEPVWEIGSGSGLKWIRTRAVGSSGNEYETTEFAVGGLGPDITHWDHASDADGNFYVVFDRIDNRVSVARFKNDGTLDKSFAEQGVLATNLSGAAREQPQIAVQPDGAILVYGVGELPQLTVNGTYDMNSMRNHLVRYDSNGQIDLSFGEDGVVKSGFRPPEFSTERAILVDSSGRILLLGAEDRLHQNLRTIKRYHPDGTLDNGFTEAVKESLASLNYCQFYDTQMVLMDGRDVVLSLRSAPNYGTGPCVNKSVLIKLLGDDAESTDVESTEVPANPADLRSAVEVSATDLNGNTLYEVVVGQKFRISVHASDLRAAPSGVFAAYVDMQFSGPAITIHEPLEFGDHFENGREGDILSYGIEEVGGFGGLSPATSSRSLLFSAVISVNAPGELKLATSAADEFPGHRFLLYGQSSTDSRESVVEYGSLQITAIPMSWQNAGRPTDVDNDGYVSPLDVLIIVNLINRLGIGSNMELQSKHYFFGLPAIEPEKTFFPDVTGDGYLAPDDVLKVIDQIHSDWLVVAAAGTEARVLGLECDEKAFHLLLADGLLLADDGSLAW